MRLLYYGAILIGLSLLVYLWRCPVDCRRHLSSQEAEDEFLRTGGVSEISYRDNWEKRLSRTSTRVFARVLSFQMAELVIQIFKAGNFASVQHYMEQHRTYFQKFGTNVPANESTLSDYFIVNSTASKDGGLEIDEEFAQLFDQVISDQYYDYSNSARVRSAAKSVYSIIYEIEWFSYPVSRRIVYFGSILGFALVALPAIDVFLQVILNDLGVL